MPRPARHALLAALACLGGLLVVALVTFSPLGRALDEAAMRGFVDLHRDWSRPLATPFVGLAGIGPALLLLAGLALVAIARGRPRLALLIVAMTGASALTTGVLKQLATDPRTCGCVADFQIGAGAWPSGHTTIAMSLILSAILVTPAARRPLAACLGGAVAIAFAFALMVMGWHYPTEVLAGLMVPAFWALAGLGAMWCGRRALARAQRAARPPSRLGSGAEADRRERGARRARAGRARRTATGRRRGVR